MPPQGLELHLPQSEEDLADVAAKVALNAGDHVGRTYELEGVEAFGGQDVADLLAETTGRPVVYRAGRLGDVWEMPGARYQVAHAVSTFSNILAGRLDLRSGDLLTLLDGPPRSARDLVARA